MFSKSTLDEIRQRISIAKLVGERIPLKRSGRNFKANCPFHKEKTPSFMVSDDKGIYHCFGCGEGGDIFQFVMKFDGSTFSESVQYLAQKAGVEVHEETDPSQRAREEETAKRKRLLLRVNEIAMEHFQACLADPKRGAKAVEYLQGRGITEEVFKQHLVGMADDSWDRLTNKLSEKGVPLELAEELGLARKRDGGGYYDFFRDRLMFPILSPRGETIGFGGRALTEGGEGERAAKYMNSPDSAVYHKSACVYGLDRSAPAIRSTDQAVLVEGYMDFIALHQAGIENVAAPLGTALTPGHISLLMRYTRNMVLVFDGDEAGRRAAVRALPVFIESGIMPRVVALPAGEDPDDVVRKEGGDSFRGRIERAIPLFEHFVELTVRETGLDSAGKSEALKVIVPLMKKVSDSVDASVLRQHVSRRLDVDEKVIARAIDPGQAKVAVAVDKPSGAAQNANDGDRSAERMLVETILKNPSAVDAVLEMMGPAHFCDEWCRTVMGILMDAYNESGALDIRELAEGIEDDELAKQVRAIALEDDSEGGGISDEEVATLISDCVAKILSRPVRARIDAINDDIRRAESEGDEDKMLKLLAEKKELIEKVHVRNG